MVGMYEENLVFITLLLFSKGNFNMNDLVAYDPVGLS